MLLRRSEGANHVLKPELQETGSWPSECESFHDFHKPNPILDEVES
jgi:hypothetical protein